VGKNDELNALVNKLVSAENPEEVKEAYATWAENYNNDLNNFGYVAPLIGSELLIKHTSNEESLIHDAGCGTGLVGTLLKEQGYTNLQGSDFSPEMLEKADALQIYGNLVELDFGNPLPVADSHFDAVISIGVYTKRFKSYFLSECIRTLKPGGWFVWSCRELYLEEVMQQVTEFFNTKKLHRMEIVHDAYMTGQKAFAYYFAVQKSNAN